MLDYGSTSGITIGMGEVVSCSPLESAGEILEERGKGIKEENRDERGKGMEKGNKKEKRKK